MGASAAAGGDAALSSVAPHSPQNRSSGAFADPHAGHERASGLPHWPQYLRPDALSSPQLAQIMRPPLGEIA